MKKLFILLLSFSLFSSCAIPEDEKQLKEQYNNLEKLAETPEQKENLKQEYEKALKELREERKNNAASTEDSNTADAQSVNSLEFIKNIHADNFFIEDNKDKTFIITDLLIIGYHYHLSKKHGPQATLQAYPYNPKTKTYYLSNLSCYYSFLHPIFDGVHYQCTNDNDGNEYEISLSNPKQIKSLNFYNPTNSDGFSKGGTLVLIKIRGEFTGINKYSNIKEAKFENAEIIN
jgi:hypothetical protein